MDIRPLLTSWWTSTRLRSRHKTLIYFSHDKHKNIRIPTPYIIHVIHKLHITTLLDLFWLDYNISLILCPKISIWLILQSCLSCSWRGGYILIIIRKYIQSCQVSVDSIPGYNLISNPVVYKNIFSHFFSPNFKKKINFPSHWLRVLTLKWERGTFFEKVVLVSSHQTCHIQQVKSHSIIYHVQMKIVHSLWMEKKYSKGWQIHTIIIHIQHQNRDVYAC